MSLATQGRTLMAGAAKFRQDLFGTREDGTPVTVDYNQGEFPAVKGYYTSIKDRRQTEQAGFLELHDAMVRIVKPTVFTPEIDKLITITENGNEIILRIEEILGTHPLSAEWILGCKAQN